MMDVDAEAPSAVVTQAEYARLRGISRQRVNRLKAEGRLALTEDGQIRVAESDALLERLLDRSKANRAQQIRENDYTPQPKALRLSDKAGASAPAAFDQRPHSMQQPEQPDLPLPGGRPEHANAAADYWQHRCTREKAEAELKELQLAERRGELVRADEVRRERQRTAQQLCNALLMIPAKIAPVIAPHDPRRAEQALDEEIRTTLRAIVQEMQADVG